ncbi:flagellin B [Campylobacter hyointestinalis subsp. hyointestinalis]|uniref:flagellin B n=2 Tax=Campylobacter hyointestinalis TaxID=198 RepID=UPI000726F50A|nr:flagellin B [Campylobacter hyointestinalis]PPB58186.1 flagellin B [Campylobacter hyointestinalis subsp. hyointestinalis]QCU00602.1 flagellin B [Campylobacter hyointestinalis subsp. hyointestinalis]CUU78437.1 flagellin B [Campylobacter hyointestinalis subsp. hyointestinalis]
MGFRINTNIAAMNAHTNAVVNNRSLDGSLGKLSSGLRIQTAADDASGMSIADSLRAQASGLGQAVKNANDAIGIVQTADKAMDEQIKILDTIKTKSIQAAQDGQSSDSRRALQNDISRLLEELDNIAKTTSFNGQQLLNGSFSNKEFQIGSYSNETAKVSIGATDSNSIGHTRFETTNNTVLTASSKIANVTVKLSGIDGFPSGYVFKTISSGTLKTEGFKALAEQVNAVADQTGVKASVNNVQIMSATVQAGNIKGLKINGVLIGDITVKAGDDGNILTAAINAKKDETGVEASIENGKLTLATKDGRAINVDTTSVGGFSIAGGAKTKTTGAGVTYLGQLTFVRQDARDIKIGINGFSALSTNGNMSAAMFSVASIASKAFNQASVNLKYMNSGTISSTIAKAMGFFKGGESATDQSGGVNTFAGAQAMIDVAQSAQKTLDSIRADLGSVQNQLTSTINNISVTQVNVKSAESQIRDVDFAEESANFSKYNILAQSGSYAMSQANTVQQNVLKLLQ